MRRRFAAIALAFCAWATHGHAEPLRGLEAPEAYREAGEARLVGWDEAAFPNQPAVEYGYRPADRRLAGAVYWIEETPVGDLAEALGRVAAARGMSDFALRAQAPIDVSAAIALGALPVHGSGATLIGVGRLDGAPATAIAIAYSHGDKAEVDIFMAPQPAFEAIGGWLVPAMLWTGYAAGDTPEDPVAQGRMPLGAQAAMLADHLSLYIAYMRQRILQEAQTGQEISRALGDAGVMATCAGVENCHVETAPNGRGYMVFD